MMARLWRRIQNLIRRRQLDRDLAEELEFHLAMKQHENERAGLPLESARRALGNLTQAQETSRETWMFSRLETFAADIRHAFRVLLKNPIFTACAVLTLALGIGANAAIFSLIDALLLRGLPVPEPERMIQLTLRGQDPDEDTVFSYPFFEDVASKAHSFSGVFAWHSTDLSTGWGVDARPLSGAVASGNAYQTLSLPPQVGRLFEPSDDTSAAAPVVVISDHFWEREYRRDPGVIGKTIVLNQHPFTIIGVTPRVFLGVSSGNTPDVTITIHANAALHAKWQTLTSKGSWYISVLARLKPGVSASQARSELVAISPAVLKDQVIATEPLDRKRFLSQKLDLIPGAAGGSWLAKRYRQPLLLLMCISGVVLLLACVNLASLSLAQASQRQKELSVRLALGAARIRLIKQLLTESLIVSIAGACLGIAFALLATHGLLVFLSPGESALALDLHPDWRVLCFLGALAIGTGILFGAAPALQGTSVQPNDALKQTRIGLRATGHRFLLGKGLVVAQVGLSVLLMSAALLFVQTLEKLKWQNTGFDRNNILFIELNAQNAELRGPQQLAAVYDNVLAGIRRNPLVRSATLTNVVPVSGNKEWEDLQPEHWPRLSEAQRKLYIHRVGPQYFQTLGLRFLRGRDFSDHDSTAESPVILSASAARTYFPGKDPLGEFMQVGVTNARIVGIVDDAKYADLREEPPRTAYFRIKPEDSSTLVVRTGQDKAATLRELREILRQTGKDIRLGESVSLTEQIDRALVSERLVAMLASFFGALAAVLVAIGLYGVVGYSAARRTSEIGVRRALGATGPKVVWLLVREAALLSFIGIAIGIPALLLTGKFAESMLYGLKPSDPFTLVASVLAMLFITAIAALLPALRASRVDPMWALRYE